MIIHLQDGAQPMRNFDFADGPDYSKVDWDAAITAIDALAGEQTGLRPSIVDLSSYPTYQ
jgi:hypothetical protein